MSHIDDSGAAWLRIGLPVPRIHGFPLSVVAGRVGVEGRHRARQPR